LKPLIGNCLILEVDFVNKVKSLGILGDDYFKLLESHEFVRKV